MHFSGTQQAGQHLGAGGSALRQQQSGVSAASRQLLPVKYIPADDLVSLVKSMFALRHPDFRRQLEGTPSEDFDGIAREALQLWDAWLGEGSGRPQWRAAEAKAQECDYEGVGSALDALLE